MGKLPGKSEQQEQLIRSFDQLAIKKIRDSYCQQQSTTLNEDGRFFLVPPINDSTLKSTISKVKTEFKDKLDFELVGFIVTSLYYI